MNDAAQIRRRSGAPRANPVLLQIPSPKTSNRESVRRIRTVTLHSVSNRENNAWLFDQPVNIHPPQPELRKTSLNLITEFNKQSRKRSKKPPSLRVSVRKKCAEHFQQLTQILIDTMFRLEMLERRTRSERFSRKSQSQVSPVYRKLLRINALGTGRNCVAEDTRTSPSARLLAARNSLIADALPMQPAAGHWLALYPAWDAVREFACGI
jgi:hypothetical protein